MLYRQPIGQRMWMRFILTVPGQRQRYANLHAAKWYTPWSPFISLTEDLDKILQTKDRPIAAVISGYPYPEMQAPYIFTYENMPESRLIRPDGDLVPAARLEGEILFYGTGLGSYIVEMRSNPYRPGDTPNFKPPVTGIHG
ncbi:MAG: hypothetical protein AAFR56_13240 [Chloroflexota bacterium]